MAIDKQMQEQQAHDAQKLFDRNASYSCLSGVIESDEEGPQLQPRRSASYSKFRHVSGEQYESKNLDVPIVVVASEAEPWSKSGGLAIVSSAYGYEFAMKGHKTMVITPMYDDFKGLSFIGEKEIYIFGETHRVKYYHQHIVHDQAHNRGTDYVFVDHRCFRRAGGLYHDKHGEYGDNLFRFALFSLASLEAPLCCKINGSIYGDRCMFIANDWQAGLVPVYLAHKFRRHGTYLQSRCVFVVHNMGYQGAYPWSDSHLANLTLPNNSKNDLFFVYPEHMRTWDLDKGECINLTKAALVTCDRVLTVSANYAQEIKTVEGGFLLQDLCHAKGVYFGGIQNGIEDTWDPKTDRHIAANYAEDDFSGKKVCKVGLQKRLGLHENADVPLVGFVGRLTWQKGVDIMRDGVIDWLMTDTGNGITGNAQVILMGNGDEEYSNWLREIERRYPGRVCGYAGFDPKIERAMMAGCDFLLMPSRYEPCGIPQMVALTYGTVPIVHATGGLKDSVKDVRDVDPEVQAVANGYYILPLTTSTMKEVIYAALERYVRKPQEHLRLMINGMQENFYWPKAIQEYEKHFDYTMADAPYYKVY